MADSVKSVLRSVKNYAKGYSDVQIKVRQATSNDPWGPSGTLMAEIADATYNTRDFQEIMEMLDKRLNDHGKNWRHVFKSLTILDYLLHSGSEAVIQYAKDNIYIIRTLKEFQFIDEEGKDQGANVRQKSKELTALLSDEARLREERAARLQMRDRVRDEPRGGATGVYDEDEQLHRALQESKRTAARDELRRKEGMTDLELQRTLELLAEREQVQLEQRRIANQLTGGSTFSFENSSPADDFDPFQPNHKYGGGKDDPFQPNTKYGGGNDNPFQPNTTYGVGNDNPFQPNATYGGGKDNPFQPNTRYGGGKDINPIGSTYNPFLYDADTQFKQQSPPMSNSGSANNLNTLALTNTSNPFRPQLTGELMRTTFPVEPLRTQHTGPSSFGGVGGVADSGFGISQQTVQLGGFGINGAPGEYGWGGENRGMMRSYDLNSFGQSSIPVASNQPIPPKYQEVPIGQPTGSMNAPSGSHQMSGHIPTNIPAPQTGGGQYTQPFAPKSIYPPYAPTSSAPGAQGSNKVGQYAAYGQNQMPYGYEDTQNTYKSGMYGGGGPGFGAFGQSPHVQQQQLQPYTSLSQQPGMNLSTNGNFINQAQQPPQSQHPQQQSQQQGYPLNLDPWDLGRQSSQRWDF